MIESSGEVYVRKVHLLSALLIIFASTVRTTNSIQCTWISRPSSKLKWVDSTNPTRKGELMTETCKKNCQNEAILETNPPQEEHKFKFEYFIEGDHRVTLSLHVESESEPLWKKSGDYVTPQTAWESETVNIPSNAGKLYFRAYVVSSKNSFYLNGIGIPGVSKSCIDKEAITIATTSTTTTTTVKPDEIEEPEEKLELQKVEVVASLATGFTKEVTPELC